MFILFFLADVCLLPYWRSPIARHIVAEDFALVVFFYSVPPLIAIICYFAVRHGLRHLLCLCLFEVPEQPIARPPTGMDRLCCQTIPCTLASILMLAAVFFWMMGRVVGAFETTALYFVLISALTLPRLIIVELMDHQEASH